MEYVNATIVSDDGTETTRVSIVSRHIISVVEAHDNMILLGDVPKGTNTIIIVRGHDDPVPVAETYEYVRSQL